MTATDSTARIYLELGFTHIIPLGLDHILFVLCLFFLSPKLKTIIWQATAFTVAHSITLGMAVYGVVSPPAAVVEPLIALSIVFLAVENIMTETIKPQRIIMVFLFGLVHGLGFAGVLTSWGMQDHELLKSLLFFNLGVELGQVTIIIAAWLLLGYWFQSKPWYRKRVVIPISALIAGIAVFWTFERIFFN